MAEVTVKELRAKPGAWVDLGLTLPLFIVYHLGVVFLGVKNGTDFVTGQVLHLAEGSTPAYLGITLAIGLAFSIPFVLLARGQVFQPKKFLQMAVEGSIYATLMGVLVPMAVGYLFAGAGVASQGRFAGFIMSLGAGFYEELTFRVLLFGLGGKLLLWLTAKQKMSALDGAQVQGTLTLRSMGILLSWAIVCAGIFSGIHYVGELGDAFQMRSFVARTLLGLALTFIFVTRGFAAAVWTHAIYDIWVLVLRP
jgi:hypothetical protein